MGDFWKTPLGQVLLSALSLVIPAAALALRAWFQSRQRQWESTQSYLEATRFGASFPDSVPPEKLEEWAVTNLMKRRPQLTEEAARVAIRKVTTSASERPTDPGAGPGNPPPGNGGTEPQG